MTNGKPSLRYRAKVIKKNSQQVIEFVSSFSETLAVAVSLQEESVFQNENVRLFCQDESRFGILPTSRKRITDFGIKPIAEIDFIYEWFYLYGTVEPTTGETFFLNLPRLKADCFQIFLDQFSATYKESLNLVVLDNGRFHKAKSLIIPPNMILIFLPPYSPELNPIERFWQDMKSKLFSQTYQNLQQMEQQINQILRQYEKTDIQSLTSFSYFVNAANAL